MEERNYAQIGIKENIKGVWRYSANTYSDGMGFGLIYKNGRAFYEPKDYDTEKEIVYIPEYGFPEREYDQVHEGDLLSSYTRQDFLDLTGCESLASELFDELRGNIRKRYGMNGAMIQTKTDIGLKHAGHMKRYICPNLQKA